jgi:hypothetical protein
MATDTTAGLFSTPEQYQQQLSQQALANSATMAQLTPEQSARQMAQFGGYQLAGGLAGAMGAQDPMLQRQAQRRAFIQQVDATSSEALKQAIQASASDPELQQFFFNKYKELETINKTKAEATAKLREQLPTVAKLQAYRDRLVTAGAPQSDVDAVNAAIKAEGQGKGTNISVSTSADKSYGSELGNLVAKSDVALRDSANAAPEVLNSVQQTRTLLDSGKVFTGTGANAKLNVLALGQAFGVTGANDNDVIAKTQQLQQQRSKAVLNQIKSSGLGTGQGFTDKDLNFLERASAGTITLSADTIREQLKIEEKLAKASVNKWNARVKTLPAALTSSMGLSTVEAPTTPYKPSAAIPATGNPLIDKYLVAPTEGQ